MRAQPGNRFVSFVARRPRYLYPLGLNARQLVGTSVLLATPTFGFCIAFASRFVLRGLSSGGIRLYDLSPVAARFVPGGSERCPSVTPSDLSPLLGSLARSVVRRSRRPLCPRYLARWLGAKSKRNRSEFEAPSKRDRSNIQVKSK